MLPVIVAGIVVLVKHSLALAFGLSGIVAAVKFKNSLDDTKDAAYVLITIGIYALTGFEVTPAPVIGVLTILGFSLYDTVVVYARIRDNTPKVSVAGRMTYTQMASLSLNQVLMRSINTSFVALLPVAAVEQHGPHLPLATDAIINEGLVRATLALPSAAASLLVLPAMRRACVGNSSTGWLPRANRRSSRASRHFVDAMPDLIQQRQLAAVSRSQVV